MLVKVLGAAAGGAFPQWNCACSQCQRLRSGTFAGQPRTQAQVAVSARRRFLDAAERIPRPRIQIEATPQLWPSGDFTPFPHSICSNHSRRSGHRGRSALPARISAAGHLRHAFRVANPARRQQPVCAAGSRAPAGRMERDPARMLRFTVGQLRFRPVFVAWRFPWLRSQPIAKSELDARRSGARLVHRIAIGRTHGLSCREWRKLKTRGAICLTNATSCCLTERSGPRTSCAAYAAGAKRLPRWGTFLYPDHAARWPRCARSNARARSFSTSTTPTRFWMNRAQAYAEVRDAGWEVARDGMEIEV